MFQGDGQRVTRYDLDVDDGRGSCAVGMSDRSGTIIIIFWEFHANCSSGRYCAFEAYYIHFRFLDENEVQGVGAGDERD